MQCPWCINRSFSEWMQSAVAVQVQSGATLVVWTLCAPGRGVRSPVLLRIEEGLAASSCRAPQRVRRPLRRRGCSRSAMRLWRIGRGRCVANLWVSGIRLHAARTGHQARTSAFCISRLTSQKLRSHKGCAIPELAERRTCRTAQRLVLRLEHPCCCRAQCCLLDCLLTGGRGHSGGCRALAHSAAVAAETRLVILRTLKGFEERCASETVAAHTGAGAARCRPDQLARLKAAEASQTLPLQHLDRGAGPP